MLLWSAQELLPRRTTRSPGWNNPKASLVTGTSGEKTLSPKRMIPSTGERVWEENSWMETSLRSIISIAKDGMTHQGLIFIGIKQWFSWEWWKRQHLAPKLVSAQEKKKKKVFVMLSCFTSNSPLCSLLAVITMNTGVKSSTPPKIPTWWLMCDSKKLSKWILQKEWVTWLDQAS